jgi:hypothetical protein
MEKLMKTNIFRSNMHKYGLKLHYKGWGINRDFPFIKRRKPPRARAQQPYSNKKKTLRFMVRMSTVTEEPNKPASQSTTAKTLLKAGKWNCPCKPCNSFSQSHKPT